MEPSTREDYLYFKGGLAIAGWGAYPLSFDPSKIT